VAPPGDGEVARIAASVCRRVGRLLEHRGLGPGADPEEADDLRQKQPLLAELYGASVAERIAMGPHAGQRIVKVGAVEELADSAVMSGPRCASVSGFSLHADVAIAAWDRFGLERLCRYAARPPIATDRLSLLPDGRLLYQLRHRWRDGTTHVIFEPQGLLARLAALVPAPRFNVVRYHGILAPATGLRPLVVPGSEPAHLQPCQSCTENNQNAQPAEAAKKGKVRPRNYRWAELMRRVYDFDVLLCDRCGGRMRILDGIIPPQAVRKILDCLGLPSRPPPIVPVRPLLDEPQGHECSAECYRW